MLRRPGRFQSPSVKFSLGRLSRVLLALLFIYFVGAEQGATSLISGHYLHEFVHDGRHIMAFPCH